MNAERVNQIVDAHGAERVATLAILHDIQHEYHFLPRAAMQLVAQRLDIPVGHIYQMATFFKAFSLKPRGEYLIQVCLDTACHVQGSGQILEELEHQLHIRPGETTRDGKFSLEGVRCLGACALAPVVVVNDEPHGKMSAAAVCELLSALGQAGSKGDAKGDGHA